MCTSLLEESGAQSGALSDQCMQFAMNKLWFRLLLVPFPATYWVYPGTFDFPLFIGQEIRVRSVAYLQLRKLQAYPCVHHLLRQKLKHHLIKQLWLLPIAPMPTPLHRHPPRQLSLHAPISQLNNRQRPSSRKTPTPRTCHHQRLRLAPAPRSKTLPDSMPPIQRRVISHKLPIPPTIPLQRLAQEEGLVLSPLCRVGTRLAGLRLPAVPQTRSDGAAMRRRGVARKRFLQPGQGLEVIQAAIAVLSTPI